MIWYPCGTIRLYKFELRTSSQPGSLYETRILNMLHFIRDIFKHKSLRMSKALYAGLSTVPPPTQMYYATEEREKEKKQDRSLSRCRTEQTCVCVYVLESAL